MKTHTELLNKLLDAVYALPLDAKLKQIHDLQMLAAEMNGIMMSQLPPMMTLDTETSKVTPTQDADGWIENTGVMPECDISAICFNDVDIIEVKNDKQWAWGCKMSDSEKFHITHYKPA
jgi:hypothetical protein